MFRTIMYTCIFYYSYYKYFIRVIFYFDFLKNLETAADLSGPFLWRASNRFRGIHQNCLYRHRMSHRAKWVAAINSKIKKQTK